MPCPILRPVSETTTDIDAHIFETDLVAVGAFRCRPTHPLFRDSGPIRNHCVVFPRSSSMIRPSGFQTFVGNPSVVSVYNAGQEYQRQMLSPIGDHSDYFAVDDSTLRHVAAARHPRAADRNDPFMVSHVPAEPRWYYRQRQIFRRASEGRTRQSPDPLRLEEQVLLLLGDVLTAMAENDDGSRRPDRRGDRQRRDLVEAAQRALSRRAFDRLTLKDLGTELGVSPYHLCRSFREVTGVTLHRYRDRLRLAASLDAVEAGVDLSRVALDLGYSSHSHFTAAFRAAFGVPPSSAR